MRPDKTNKVRTKSGLGSKVHRQHLLPSGDSDFPFRHLTALLAHEIPVTLTCHWPGGTTGSCRKKKHMHSPRLGYCNTRHAPTCSQQIRTHSDSWPGKHRKCPHERRTDSAWLYKSNRPSHSGRAQKTRRERWNMWCSQISARPSQPRRMAPGTARCPKGCKHVQRTRWIDGVACLMWKAVCRPISHCEFKGSKWFQS